jgi:predicted ATPase
MDKFDHISIRGFRRLRQLDLEMRDLVVMIGANGSGKTSFLDILSTLSASAKGDLSEALQRKGGLNQILTRGKASELEIAVSMKSLKDRPLMQYDLALSPKGISYEISRETLSRRKNIVSPESFDYIQSYGSDIKYFQDGSLVRPTWEHNSLETSLSQAPKMYRESESLRRNLSDCTYYRPLELSEKSPIRLPQAMRPAKLPGANGENLVSAGE